MKCGGYLEITQKRANRNRGLRSVRTLDFSGKRGLCPGDPTFAGKAVSIGHEPLDGHVGQLLEAVEVLKVGCEPLEVALLKKGAQAQLDAVPWLDTTLTLLASHPPRGRG